MFHNSLSFNLLKYGHSMVLDGVKYFLPKWFKSHQCSAKKGLSYLQSLKNLCVKNIIVSFDCKESLIQSDFVDSHCKKHYILHRLGLSFNLNTQSWSTYFD